MAKRGNWLGVLSNPSWSGIGVIISVIGVGLSVLISYDIYRRSTQLSNLHVEREYWSIPFGYGDSVHRHVSIAIDGVSAKSVIVYSYSIQNTGHAAILPNDYIEPIRVVTQSPWQILTVEGADSSITGIKSEWTKVATDTFQMKPMLLNPNDRIRFLVFTTNAEKVVTYEDAFSTPIPDPQWSARIINIPSLDVTRPKSARETSGLGIFYFSTSFEGWSLYWFAIISILLFVVGIELHNRFLRLPVTTWKYRFVIISVMCLSLATADTILVPFYPGSTWVWASYVLVMLHVSLFIYLSLPAIRHKSPPQNEDLLNNLLKNKP